MSVVAGASCATSTPAGGSLSTQAWGISVLTGTKWVSQSAAPAAAVPEPETEPTFWEMEPEEEPVYFENDTDF